MQTFKITEDDIDENGFYVGKGIDTRKKIQGHVEIGANLGWVKFKRSLIVSGRLVAKAGSGIESGWGIKADRGIESGSGIKAGSGIESGWDIKTGRGIESGWGIKADRGIESGGDIKAGWDIESGWGIKADRSIESGWDIKAGWSIESGEGIKAGWDIEAKSVFAKLRIFAGLCIWRIPEKHETEIRAKLIGGEVCFGTLIEP